MLDFVRRRWWRQTLVYFGLVEPDGSTVARAPRLPPFAELLATVVVLVAALVTLTERHSILGWIYHVVAAGVFVVLSVGAYGRFRESRSSHR